MTGLDDQSWYCPLYKRTIAEGKCLDINFERLGYVRGEYLRELFRLTGKAKEAVDLKCQSCPNCPNLPPPPPELRA